MRNEVVTKGHKHWNALCIRLSEGLRIEGCNGTNSITERILQSLPNVDVAGTIAAFQQMSGYCDCEILNTIYEEDDC